MLGLLGIRFVIAESGDLPGQLFGRLDEQLDLDLVPAGGFVVYRNAAEVPPASLIASNDYLLASERSDLLTVSELPPAHATALAGSDGSFTGVGGGEAAGAQPGASGLAYLADQFAPGWRLSSEAETVPGARAFGWATAFPAPAGNAFRITYGRQWIRTAQMFVLALLWASALWITRRPAGR